MTKIFFLLLGLFVYGIVVGQSLSLDVENPITVFTPVDGADQDITSHAFFSHTLNGTRTFVWERTVEYISPGWESAVCDLNRCYIPSVDSESFTANAVVSNTLDVHVYTGGRLGDSAVIHINIYEMDNPSNNVQATFRVYSNTVVAVEDHFIEDVTIVPNPADDYFLINHEKKVSHINVYNLTGSILKSFAAGYSDHFHYDVSDLNSSIYLVHVLDRNGSVIGAQKMYIH